MTESTSEYKKRIEEIKQSIENEPYMAKMREDIAEGISKTGIRQATVEEQFQDVQDHYEATVQEKFQNIDDQFQAVIDETTGKDVISAPEVILARNGEADLKTRLDKEKQEVTAQLQQTEQELSSQLAQTASNFKLDKDNESAPLGDELSRSEGWQLGTNWSGDFNTGFTHSHGAAGELVFNFNAIAGSIYFVKLTVTDADTMNSGFKFRVIIGDSHESEMYRGVGSVITYTKAIKAENDGDLKVLADSDFTGTVTDISIKEVVGTIQPTLNIKDGDGESVYEIRPSLTNLLNLITGRNAGRKNISGYENTVYGDEAFTENVSGFWNTVSGKEALAKGVSASRNNPYGYKALAELIDGTRNQAYGTFALTRLKHGSHNVAMGADTLWKLIEGDYNIAFGTTSLDYLEKGLANIGIGYKTLSGLIEGSYNVAIGHLTARNTKVNNQTAVGTFAANANVNGDGLSAFGYGALRNALGNFNSAFGNSSLLALVTGTYNDAFGRTALSSLVNGTGNKVFGGQGLRNLIEGSYNVGFGFNVGQTLVNGSNNILIGNGVDVPNENTSNHMNIGKLIYGDLANNRLGIGIAAPLAKLHIGAGTASVAPIRINAGSLLSTPQQHVMEYDGAFMYITSSSGIRRKFVTEPA